jgi:hypothetical protein
MIKDLCRDVYSHRLVLSFLVALLPLSSGPACGKDWPQWRGPQSDGISCETDLLLDWTEKSPRILWQRPLGTGFSSFAVADGRLFTLAAIDDLESAFCLDADTGKTLWQVPLGKRYKDGQGADGPRSTPTVHDDRVYVLGAGGDLLCLDVTDGKIRWPRHILQEFQVENLEWGVSTSPYIDGENLLVNVGGEDASIVAFEKSTGQVVWKNLSDVAGYASPIRINVAGPNGQAVPELVFFCGRALVGVSPEDGAEHWRHEWLTTSDMNIATPIYEPESQLLFVSAARDTGRCSAFRLAADQDAVTSRLVYTNEEMRNHYNSCILLDGYLYGFDHSVLKCIELDTGRLMWSDRTVGKGSLVAAQGHLLVLGERGELAVVEATPDQYREKGRFQALDSTRAWSPPAVANGRLYIRDLENAVCVDISQP